MISNEAFPIKVVPILVCRKEIMSRQEFVERIKELKENLSVKAQIIKGVIINKESDLTSLEEPVKEADVILLLNHILVWGGV